MLQLLFTTTYLLDIIILILIIFLVLELSQMIKSLGEQYSFLEKIKLTPDLLTNKPAVAFEKYAKRHKAGTFLASFNQHKRFNKLTKRFIQALLGFLAIKLVVVSLIFLNIPRPSEAQPEIIRYQDADYSNFSKGVRTQTDWDQNGIVLSAGQYYGNFISQPIGSDKIVNQWKNLSWQTDRNYGKLPAYPKGTLAVWPLDSLDNCIDQTFKNYNCETQKVKLTRGLYYSSAYYFNGSDAKAKISQNLSFNASFTVGAWIKPKINILNGSQDQNFVILAKGYGDYLATSPYQLKYSYFLGFKDGALELIFWPDDNQDHFVMVKDAKDNFSADLWYQVAGVYDDQNKTLKLYIDGIEHSDIVADYDGGKIDHKPNTKTNYPTWIGGIGYRWLDKQEKMVNVFEGAIDEVFLVNSALGILDIRNWVTQAGEISFQIRTGDTLPLANDFLGPDGQTTSYFTDSNSNDLSSLNPSKYLQYIAYLSRPTTTFNPKLLSVIIDYLSSGEENNVRITAQSSQQVNPNPERDLVKEKIATQLFLDFFKTLPKNDKDWEFINLVAYGQVEQRDLSLEQKALTAFVKYYKRLPKSDIDWGVIKALAYSQKGLDLQNTWLKLK